MIDKATSAVTVEDIDALIRGGRIEDRTIEYKRDLPTASDDDRREFLRDVSSFANGLGGDILYGVEETAGAPTGAPGVEIVNFDELRLRLQNTLHSNLDPRLPAIDIEHVTGFPKGSVVIVRAHQSWRAPHMITFKGLGKFYIRGNGQRHEMDVAELRSAFVGSEAIADRIRAFRDGRLGHILSGQSAMKSLTAPAFVVHVMPIGVAFSNSDIDARRIGDRWFALNRERKMFELVYAASARPNLDGLLISSPDYERRFHLSPSYIQVFRNGSIEFAEAQVNPHADGLVPSPWLAREYVEAQLLDAVHNAIAFRGDVGLTGAALVCVALLRANGLPVGTVGLAAFRDQRSFDRDSIVLPDIIIEEGEDVTLVMRPVFDALWQAAGFQGSDSYGADGAYIGKSAR